MFQHTASALCKKAGNKVQQARGNIHKPHFKRLRRELKGSKQVMVVVVVFCTDLGPRGVGPNKVADDTA
jgi:hypothetical protein